MLHTPNGFPELVMDIMLAVLADVGFEGRGNFTVRISVLLDVSRLDFLLSKASV
jgi:hypothetical protein